MPPDCLSVSVSARHQYSILATTDEVAEDDGRCLAVEKALQLLGIMSLGQQLLPCSDRSKPFVLQIDWNGKRAGKLFRRSPGTFSGFALYTGRAEGKSNDEGCRFEP